MAKKKENDTEPTVSVSVSFGSYIWQVLQLEAEQLAHELDVPAIGLDSPPLPLENEAKREKTRLDAC